MSTPIADYSDLAVFLGLDAPTDAGAIERMTLLIRLAQDLAETVVSPIPASAQGTVLAVAGRAYSNPNSATQIGMGSAYATIASTGAGGVGGLYLSRADKAALRRNAGRTGAFSVDLIPDA